MDLLTGVLLFFAFCINPKNRKAHVAHAASRKQASIIEAWGAERMGLALLINMAVATHSLKRHRAPIAW